MKSFSHFQVFLLSWEHFANMWKCRFACDCWATLKFALRLWRAWQYFGFWSHMISGAKRSIIQFAAHLGWAPVSRRSVSFLANLADIRGHVGSLKYYFANKWLRNHRSGGRGHASRVFRSVSAFKVFRIKAVHSLVIAYCFVNYKLGLLLWSAFAKYRLKDLGHEQPTRLMFTLLMLSLW